MIIPASSDKLRVLIQQELDQIFTPENSQMWWNLPNNALNGKTPYNLVEEGNGQRVLLLLRSFGR
jgi:hypothetical protein